MESHKKPIKLIERTLNKKEKQDFRKWLSSERSLKDSYAYCLANGFGKRGNCHYKRAQQLFGEFCKENSLISDSSQPLIVRTGSARDTVDFAFDKRPIGSFEINGDTITDKTTEKIRLLSSDDQSIVIPQQDTAHTLESNIKFKEESVCLIKYVDGTKAIVSKSYKVGIMDVEKISTVELVPIKL